MRVLSAIITHPLRKVCNATSAGMQLSEAVARLIELDTAIMWDNDETVIAGDLVVRRVRSKNGLGMFNHVVPRFAKVPLYDSKIPEMLDGGYDLVHIHNLIPTLAAARLSRACKRHGMPYVISTHGFFELSAYAKIHGFGPIKSALVDLAMTRPFRQIVADATRILALSDCEGEMLAEMGVRPEIIDIVTNGVAEYFLAAPTEREIQDARAKFAIGAAPVLLFKGNLGSGANIFLQSLTGLGIEFQAIVVGPLERAAQAEGLLTAADVPQTLRNRILFTGELTDDDLRALYHLADLFVYPSQGDSLPLPLLEAMACGLPVVSTAVGGISFAVTRECGILVPPNDSKGIADAVVTMLNSRQRRAMAGMRARERVIKTFRWEASAKHAVASYEKAVAVQRRTFTVADRVHMS